MKRNMWTVALLIVALSMVSGLAFAQTEQKLTISGVSYTKWLWGNQRYDGSMYNFTTVPGEGFGDNGQGTEIELLVQGKPNRYVEVSGRIHSRFSQNFWTNFGGFGGANPAADNAPPCVGGDCGENDPRSNQYVKLRGLTMRVTPGWNNVDAITFGASDLGMFDPFTIGKIRYIDRDNTGAIFVQGKVGSLRYDVARISLPRLWAGPEYNTGQFTTQDSAYALQFRYDANAMFDVGFIADRVRDIEVDGSDRNVDNGREITNRYSNDVYGLKVGFHPNTVFDMRAAYYDSSSRSNGKLTPTSFFGISGFSPVPAGDHDDQSYKVNLDINDPFGAGLSFNLEYFNIGAEYVSIMAARRESDVLLTEGRDATWAMPGPANAAFGVFGGNPTRIGYAGWQGNAQQVATINVDNEFMDFDEPLAESVIGWKGFTIVPVWKSGDLELAGEFTMVDYNTNWQAWGDRSKPILSTVYPNMESDAGVMGGYRNAYAPFQDRDMTIALVRGKYTLDVGKGVDLFGKLKFIDESDKRMNDAAFLPYQSGDCPGGATACKNAKRFYSTGNSTSDLYGNPGLVTVGGVTGYQWKPFDNIGDDDKDMDYKMMQVGAGYQFTDIVYSSLTYEYYDVDLHDGNTAFQAYQLHEMASGQHQKNKMILAVRFPIGGTEAGLSYEYAFGTFDPDFGTGFVPQIATEQISSEHNVAVGSRGFSGRFGGWNSLEEREFSQQHLKAYFKVRF